MVRLVPVVSDEVYARVSALGAAPAAPLRLPLSTNLSHPQTPEIPELEPIQAGDAPERMQCPDSKGLAFLSAATGAVVPARCRRLSCEVCIHIQARRRALAISLAAPERAILVTDTGSTWQEVQPRMNRLRHRIAEATGKPFEWLYNVEPNPSGDGKNHCHAWTHGAFVPQATLSRLAQREGMGSFARINRVRTAVGASQYGLKGLGYGLKGTEGTAARAEFMLLNGRRLTHQSRGFFRGADGVRLSARAAESAAIEANPNRDPGPWTLIAL